MKLLGWVPWAAAGYGLAGVALGVVVLILLLWGWRWVRAVRDAVQDGQRWLRDERRAWETVLRDARGAIERCSALMGAVAEATIKDSMHPERTVETAGLGSAPGSAGNRAGGWAGGGERIAGRDLSAGPPPGAGQNLNVSVRSQVLRRSRRGESAAQIAAGLAVPRDEVALLLKIHDLSSPAAAPEPKAGA